MHGHAWLCMGVCGCGQVLGSVGRCERVCVDMHGCAHVCGINFQNFFPPFLQIKQLKSLNYL